MEGVEGLSEGEGLLGLLGVEDGEGLGELGVLAPPHFTWFCSAAVQDLTLLHTVGTRCIGQETLMLFQRKPG